MLTVKKFDQSARVLGMSSRQSVTNGKAAQHAATSTPVLSNADSGATGNYIRLADINVLRDVRLSSPAEQIAVAVADGNLLYSTHHGILDVPGQKTCRHLRSASGVDVVYGREIPV